MNESVLWEISEFMEQNDYIMYDIFINRMGRNNQCGGDGITQPLWCQAIWLKDFIAAEITPSEKNALVALETAIILKIL